MLPKLITAGCVVAGVGATLLLIASVRPGGPLSFSSHHQEQANPAAANSSQGRSLEVEIVVLGRSGFEPKEITRPPGPFILALNNQSGLAELEVSLDREAGPRVQRTNVSKNKTKWRQKMTLPPGTYVLREAAHPEWACRITIQQ